MPTQILQTAIKNLLLLNQGFDGPFDILPIKGGANNQVYVMYCTDGSKFILKKYFQHKQDPRNRIQTEFLFSRYLWDHGIHTIPKPLGCDFHHKIALYEYLDGDKVVQKNISKDHIRQAADFYRNMNHFRKEADHINNASEACFSLRDHLDSVDRRLINLTAIQSKSEIDRRAVEFVTTKLCGTWNVFKENVTDAWIKTGLEPDTPINKDNRRLSPSDFGFHNALLLPDDRLKFFDFEYAGWDNPIKMICDFFCQPEIPVPIKYFDFFTEIVLEDLENKEQCRTSINLLFPAYKIKWCCIMLNEFLPIGIKRRQFSGNISDFEERKKNQLLKAKKTLRYVDFHC